MIIKKLFSLTITLLLITSLIGCSAFSGSGGANENATQSGKMKMEQQQLVYRLGVLPMS